MKLVLALALASVSALPVPKPTFLRGSHDDKDTSLTHRPDGRHTSFGMAETATPAPTYQSCPPLSALPQDSQECIDAVERIDEIRSCDDVGLKNKDLCKLDVGTTACTVPSGDSCIVRAVGKERRLLVASGVYSVGLKGGADASACFAKPGGGTCSECCGGCKPVTLADARSLTSMSDWGGFSSPITQYHFGSEPNCVCLEASIDASTTSTFTKIVLSGHDDCANVENFHTEPHYKTDLNEVYIFGAGGSDAIHYKLTCDDSERPLPPTYWCPGPAYISGGGDQDFLTADLSTATYHRESGPNILARLYGFSYTGTPGSRPPFCSLTKDGCPAGNDGDDEDLNDLSEDVLKVTGIGEGRAVLYGSNGDNQMELNQGAGFQSSFFNAGLGYDVCKLDGVTQCEQLSEFMGCTCTPCANPSKGFVPVLFERFHDGYAVELNTAGDTLALGYPEAEASKGLVNVFRKDTNGVWTHPITILGDNAGDHAGSALSLSDAGDYLAIGEPLWSNAKGRVRVFQLSGSTWSQVGDPIVGSQPGDYAGRDLALNSGNFAPNSLRIAVGAHGFDNNRGKVYTMRLGSFGWESFNDDDDQLEGKNAGDMFGYSVALNRYNDFAGSFVQDGTQLIVGEPGWSSGKGRVSLWLSQETLQYWAPYGFQTADTDRYTIEGVNAGEHLGTAVAMSRIGSTVVVGGYDSSNSLGSVRAYQAQKKSSPGDVLGWYEIGTDCTLVESFGQPTRGMAIVEGQVGYSLAMAVDFTDFLNVAVASMGDSFKGQVMVYAYPFSNSQPAVDEAWQPLVEDLQGDNDGDRFGGSAGMLTSTPISMDGEGTELAVGAGVGSSPSSCTCDQELELSVTTDNYPTEIGWTLAMTSVGCPNDDKSFPPDSYTDKGATKTDVISTQICAGETYCFTMTDTYGDGICCAEGNGSYELTLEGNVVASGGNYGASDQTCFVAGGTGTPLPKPSVTDSYARVYEFTACSPDVIPEPDVCEFGEPM